MSDCARAVLDILHSLRSIHGDFSDRPVPDDAVRTITAAAVRAANAGARQCYSIITVTGMERVKSACCYPAPVALVFLSDHTRFQDEALRRGYGLRPYSLHDLITTAIDASVAGQNAVIAAKALGIDSLITNSILDRVEMNELIETLGIPERGCMPLFAVLLGYPKIEPDHRQQRYDGPGLLHAEKYRRMTEDERLAMASQYDEEGMGLAFAKWREQGYQSYFDWYFNAWDIHPGAKNHKERDPDWSEDYARRAGFIN
ncbi:MAG: nitroreductase family protein [Planctomycetota bacterium]|jgi:nitroreductase|nr:nitroreductase family protein [Planctomycetota bacterium]